MIIRLIELLQRHNYSFYFLRRRSGSIVIDNLTVLVDEHVPGDEIDVVLIHELCGFRIQDAIDLAAGQLQLVKRCAHLAVVIVC